MNFPVSMRGPLSAVWTGIKISALILILALCMASGLAGCSNGSLAGTDAGNTQKVAGILTDREGKPVAARLVQLRNADFQGNLQDTELIRPALGKEWTEFTGPAGEFSFLLGATDTGNFVCEALLNEVEGVRIHFRRDSSQSVDLGMLAMRPIGGISGKVLLPQGTFGSLAIALLGTHQSYYLGSGNGDFAFYSLPAGDYTLRIEGINPIRKGVDTSFTVPAGKTLSGITLAPGPAAAEAPGQIALQLRSPRPLAGSLKAKLAEGGNVLAADSNGHVVFKNVSSGLHMVLTWGENPYRDTLKIPGIQVEPGKESVLPTVAFKPKVLIVDGIANHDWVRMTLYNKTILDLSGLFQVDVSTTPPDKSTPMAWAAWHPHFSDFDAVVLECNSAYPDDGKANPWPDSIKKSLEDFVSGGGGLVNTHATFPGFYGWPAFDQMHGLIWRNVDTMGPSYELDSMNALVPNPEGLNLSSYENPNIGVIGEHLHVADSSHPITRGLPLEWPQPLDSPVYQLKGIPDGLTVLAYSVSPISGKHEPEIWSKPFGSGRVFTTAMGHIYPGDSNNPYRCVGYQTTFTRGVEWAATGKVTTRVPSDFPGRDSLSLRNNLPN